jgi:site-specific DNA recombinase
MASDGPNAQGDVLVEWLRQQQPVRARMGGRRPPVSGGLRFAFYGRISTADFQDRTSSRAWQYESAADLVGGRGVIVAEYFDVGCSRRLPWAQRPQAAALLDAIAAPGRRFDAIVVGEYERAFAGDQLIHLLPMLNQYGVQVWLPEAGNPINVDDPAHRALILLLGHQSRREILRSRFRTTAAMRAQARDQGPHLGGR